MKRLGWVLLLSLGFALLPFLTGCMSFDEAVQRTKDQAAMAGLTQVEFLPTDGGCAGRNDCARGWAHFFRLRGYDKTGAKVFVRVCCYWTDGCFLSFGAK